MMASAMPRNSLDQLGFNPAMMLPLLMFFSIIPATIMPRGAGTCICGAGRQEWSGRAKLCLWFLDAASKQPLHRLSKYQTAECLTLSRAMPKTRAENHMKMIAQASPWLGRKGLPIDRNRPAYRATARKSRLIEL